MRAFIIPNLSFGFIPDGGMDVTWKKPLRPYKVHLVPIPFSVLLSMDGLRLGDVYSYAKRFKQTL